MKFKTINPATEEVIDEYETMKQEDVLKILDQSYEDFKNWRVLTLDERIPYFKNLALVLREHLDRFAGLMTEEMGKPITEAKAEVEKCAWLCEVYAEHSEEWLAEETVQADGKKHKVIFQPLGIVVSIMPWNFPFWQAIRFAVPTLMAGNVSILKHSNQVPKCAMAIEEAFKLAGFPENAFRALLLDHDTTAKLIGSDLVQGISLTGSTGAGSRIAEQAGRNLKKVVLELGGSDPFIVLEDADVNVVAVRAVQGRFLNCGQSCIASKRFIIHESLAEEFGKKFAEETAKLKIGDPAKKDTKIGPLVNKQALDQIQGQMKDAVDKGAKVLTGGKAIEGKGYFFEPTVVTNTKPDMKVVSEEVFGPIAPIITFKEVDEAIKIANSSEFGLGGSVWTKDLAKGEEIARKIESGTVFVNMFTKSDPRMPFGGVKRSGIGRELSKYGLHEFVNTKGLNVYEHKL